MFRKIKKSFIFSFLNPRYLSHIIEASLRENEKISFADNSLKNKIRFSLLPSHKKENNLSPEDRAYFFELNRKWNNNIYAGEKGLEYEERHSYGDNNYEQFSRKRVLADYLFDKKYKNVLEVGAGTGYYTVEYSRLVGHVDAIELVEDLIEKFRENIREKNISNIDIIKSDIDHFAGEKKYDCVIFISALHHIPFRMELFKKMADLLESGGEIILLEPHHNVLRKLKIILQFYNKRDFDFNPGHDFISRPELEFYSKNIGAELKIFRTSSNRFFQKINNERRFKIETAIGKIFFLKNFQDSVFSVIKKK